MTRVVTFGETLALLDVDSAGRMGPDTRVPIGIGGAESNVAIGLVRLGVDTTWVGSLGDDALGSFVIRELRAEGVRVRADRDPVAPTGLMLKERRNGRPARVRYYRAGSAAARVTAAGLGAAVSDAVRAASVLHLTGVTAALGPGPRAALEHLVGVARAAGTVVSFDVNHRATLWPADIAGPVLAGIVAGCDLVFAGPEEAALLVGSDTAAAGTTPEAAAAAGRALTALGPATAVVKLGGDGAVAVSRSASGEEVRHDPADRVTVVDPVGAGDAFAAGYLAELVSGAPLGVRLRTANRCAGAVCAVHGDWEGLPTRAELGSRGELVEVRR